MMEGSSSEAEDAMSFTNMGRYRKGGSAGSKGADYQVGLLVVVLLNAMKKLSRWRLSTENESAGKFDDIVVEWPESQVLIQAKHKEKRAKGITLEDLMSVNSKKDEFSIPKYFLSYLKIRENLTDHHRVVICTNLDVNRDVSLFLDDPVNDPESLLHHEVEDCSYHTFKYTILPVLKENTILYYRQNFVNKGVEESEITNENLQEFLNHLQIYFCYPPQDNMSKVLENLLSSTDCNSKISAVELSSKIKDWFQQKHGEYFSEIHAKAAFSEIRTDKYFQSLKKHRVFFKKEPSNFEGPTRVFHVLPQRKYLLQVMKICETFQLNQSKVLCYEPEDETEVLQHTVEAFDLPRYTTLLIISPDDIEEPTVNEISNKLKKSMERYDYKKVVLVCKDNRLFQQLEFEDSCETIRESVTLEDLATDLQRRLLKASIIVFQGQNVGLEELFSGQMSDDQMRLINAEILEKLIHGERIKIGSLVEALETHISLYYVDRTFERDTEEEGKTETMEKRTETLAEEDMYEINERMVLIQDDAGAGKSTVLAHLASTIKKKYPHLWVVLVKLNDYTEVLNEFVGSYKHTITIMELLNARNTTKLTNELEELVFLQPLKVVVLIDGVDEISPDYTNLVLNMVGQCQSATNFAKVFVTTRPHLTDDLERILNVKAFKLQPFTHQNQINFLTNYWSHHLAIDETNRSRCKKYAEELLNKTSYFINSSNEQHFAAKPLQVMMLAEIFEDSSRLEGLTDWEGCKEFLNGNEEIPKLQRKMNATEIYKMFILKKQNLYKVKGNPTGNTAANQALLSQFDECLVHHRNLGLQEVLQKSECELFSDYHHTHENETIILKMGIVHKTEDKFYFCHRTFAEYFVAESILKELQLQVNLKKTGFHILFNRILMKLKSRNHDQTEKFQKFFFDEVLLTPRFKMVRVFFNGFLQKDSLPADIFQSYESLSYDVDLNASYNLISELTKEGCVTILELLFKCINFEVVRGKEVRKEDFLKVHSKFSNALKVLKYLARQGGVNIRDGFYRKPLYFALGLEDLEMVRFLVEKGATIMDSMLYDAVYKNHVDLVAYLLEKMLEDGTEVTDKPIVPYAMAYLGQVDRLRDLVENGLDVNYSLENDESLVFGAARGGQLHTIRYLVEQGVNINNQDKGGNTALHVIADIPSRTDTAELLVQLGADINAMDFSHMTPLHLSTRNSDMVEFLVRRGANLNLKDDFGKTPLCKAIQQNHVGSAKFLIANGCDVDCRDDKSRTALHYAAEEGQLDIIKLLTTKYTSSTSAFEDRDVDGSSMMHFASSKGKFETVKYLVEHSADVNVRNNEGRTPLHLAALEGHLQTIEYLAEHSEDINSKDKQDNTALHYAAAKGRLKVLKYLIKHPKNVEYTKRLERQISNYPTRNFHNAPPRQVRSFYDAEVNFLNSSQKAAFILGTGDVNLHMMHVTPKNSQLRWMINMKKLEGN